MGSIVEDEFLEVFILRCIIDIEGSRRAAISSDENIACIELPMHRPVECCVDAVCPPMAEVDRCFLIKDICIVGAGDSIPADHAVISRRI